MFQIHFHHHAMSLEMLMAEHIGKNKNVWQAAKRSHVFFTYAELKLISIEIVWGG